MIRINFILGLLFLISQQVDAQQRVTQQRVTQQWTAQSGQGPSRIVVRGAMSSDIVEVERIAYFSEKIGLTPEEAQLFWPIYNEMDKNRNALFEERAAIIQKFMTEGASMTDRQIDDNLKRLVAIQQQEMALPAEYDARFRKVMPARKVMNMHVAEMGFRNYLLQRMQLRREGDRPER